MAYTDVERQRIGRAVERSRMAAGRSKEQAAAEAGLNSITWKRVEDGESVQSASLGKILASLKLDLDDVLSDKQVPRPGDVALAVTPREISVGLPTAQQVHSHWSRLADQLRPRLPHSASRLGWLIAEMMPRDQSERHRQMIDLTLHITQVTAVLAQDLEDPEIEARYATLLLDIALQALRLLSEPGGLAPDLDGPPL